jgi:hypothetical protein
MEQDKWVGRSVGDSVVPHAGETNADYRARLAHLREEALERRQQQLNEQSSPHNTPSDRIRIWERLHQVELPRNPAHRLVAVIAANTGLSAEEVLAEQRVRAKSTTPIPSPL